MQHIYGNQSRIFLNTALGCDASCAYCYLPKLGIGGETGYISANQAFKILKELPYFEPGKDGTILSLGCYSECWSEKNRIQTLDLLEKLVELGNPIQLATKKMISAEDIFKIDALSVWKNQIGIYLSTPTLSSSEEIEPGTASPDCRLLPLRYMKEIRSLYFVLYIKPVIGGITICDMAQYRNLMKLYPELSVVVGAMLTMRHEKGNFAQVGEGKLQEKVVEDNDILAWELGKERVVYRHSTDVVKAKVELFEL
ncbi:MAG: hypothetical protein LUF00_00145 [Lachnospiraceae bacterium]|nr:hypothetical protein [Lachnospiraceae bacterium]